MNLRRKLEKRKFRVHPLNAEEIMLVQRVKGEYYQPTRDFMGQHFSRSIFGVDYESGC